jgi:hypothetical protein
MAWRNSRFARASAFSRSARSVGAPARLPGSTSAFFHPLVQRPRRATDLPGDRRHGRPARRMSPLVLQRHPNGALAHLR